MNLGHFNVIALTEKDAAEYPGGKERALSADTDDHEARRIDNQLRGRSGRQGDPGESRFYLAMTDDIMRLFGSEKVLNMEVLCARSTGGYVSYKLSELLPHTFKFGNF